MVSMFAVPLPVGTILYQMVFERPVTKGMFALCAQAGVGSLVSVVALELSLVSVKVLAVMVIALAKLSFAGRGATTVNVGNVTVCVVRVVPPPGRGFCTPTEFVLPNPAINVAGTVAERCVESVSVVAMAVPPTSGFISTMEFEQKFVPVTVMGVFAEFTGALVGETLEIVGAKPNTENGKELLVAAPSVTVTCATPPQARSEAVIVAVSCVVLAKLVVLELPFHFTVEPAVKPVPLTVSVVAAAGALAEKGESLPMVKAGVLGPGPRLMSHTPRPCVAARRVRDGS